MVNKFFLVESKNSPRICFDPDNKVFEISGRSFPENAEKFYRGVLLWIENFAPTENSSITVDFKFQYVSSSSVICVLQVLKQFESLATRGCKVSINWLYQLDDEDIRITGEDLASLTDLHFEYPTY